jgi:predicted TIM-barrel fold metal-dependent hydrolase
MAAAADALRQHGVVDGPDAQVDEIVRVASLVDHHVHSIRLGRLTRDQLILGLSETDRQAAADAGGMDHQLGIAVRRWCAPLLGLERGVTADAWIEHRVTLDNEAVAATLLPLAGVERLLVDTGYRTGELAAVDVLGRLAGAHAREVVRLEALAERVATSGVDAAGFARAFHDALEAARPSTMAWKSIIAYRFGLAVGPRPAPPDLVEPVGRWLRSIAGGGPVRLVDPVILHFVLWSAVDTGMPIQVHAGYGDPDLDLARGDPLLLTDFIRATEGACQILLLHCYPYQRHAGYLAQMFPHVSMEVGLAVNHTGARSEQLIAETLEVAPFRKVLFSSDAWGLPELHLLGSWLFRRGLGRVLGRWVRAGDWGIDDARRFVALVGRENALRIYGP